MRAKRIISRLRRHAQRWWYLPFVTLLAGLDLFIGIVPVEGVLVSSVLLRPQHWIRFSFALTTGSAVGAVALGALVSHFRWDFVEWLAPGGLQSETWATTATMVESYGALALGLFAVGPLPQMPAVVLCALGNVPLSTIFISVWLGRGIKYGLFGWGATHAPKLFRPLFKKMNETEAALEIDSSD